MTPSTAIQTDLFAEPVVNAPIDQSTTFADNLSLPIHRWFRYSAGFSALWVRDLILRNQAEGRTRFFDPFVGSGTVVLEAEGCGASGIGVEAHPFVARVARAKTLWRQDRPAFIKHAQKILEHARQIKGQVTDYPPLIHKCFPDDTLLRLDALRRSWQEFADGGSASELCWLAMMAILRECSPVGTAQWQYVLPKKSKKIAAEPFAAFAAKYMLFVGDMSSTRNIPQLGQAVIYEEDARECPSIPAQSIEAVITSPPYANNYDYADAARLEMTFLGEIQGWGDLQSQVRSRLIHSCTQHAASQREHMESILAGETLAPIRHELSAVCRRLTNEKSNHGGKKDYDVMLALYFSDLGRVWKTLRRLCVPGVAACWVVGDSAPYGIHAPVDRWLGELALAAGFKSYHFEKTRDRNVKWKNRKHRVPLHEGRLWVEG